jgi:ribosomal protein S27E
MTERSCTHSRNGAIAGTACTTMSDPSPVDGKIRFECPGCRKRLRIRPEYLGSAVGCNRCGHHFVTPKGGSCPRRIEQMAS